MTFVELSVPAGSTPNAVRAPLALVAFVPPFAIGRVPVTSVVNTIDPRVIV